MRQAIQRLRMRGMTLTILTILAILALVLVIAAVATKDRIPLWVAVVLLAIIECLRAIPLGK